MNQPSAPYDPDSRTAPARAAGVGSIAAIGGVGFLVTSLASDLVIGNYPRPDTTAAELVTYYDSHHSQVLAGGWLLAVSGIFFVLLGTAVWARVRQAAASPVLAGLALIGTVLTAMTTFDTAGTFGLLGGIGGEHAVAPAALQAWHVLGSSGSLADGASTFVFLLAVAGAGILARALPRALAWSALVLAVLQLLPDQLGFFASLVFLLWAAVAGIVLLFARAPRSPLPVTSRQAPARSEAGPSPAT